MEIAGYAQVLGMADICAELQRVVAKSVGHISHPLKFVFLFVERAVALVNRERISKCQSRASQLIHGDAGHARGVVIVEVQAGNSGIFCRRSTQAVGIHEHAVAKESEAEVAYPVVIDDVGGPVSQTLVPE